MWMIFRSLGITSKIIGLNSYFVDGCSLAVLEGIAVSFDPNYKVLGSTYPWIARKVLTGNSPKLKSSLISLLYKVKHPLLCKYVFVCYILVLSNITWSIQLVHFICLHDRKEFSGLIVWSLWLQRWYFYFILFFKLTFTTIFCILFFYLYLALNLQLFRCTIFSFLACLRCNLYLD